ncbi:acyltransferase domain-containing protein [Actinokineospora sp. UTMC 2448]|uniref:acyltransferase domain-containing protein n=1 Tax=Actinokineospora sp. UTMC 2448 TaxID=2268449 RepID=UPI002164EB5A|nr:acyltransferase domain-containing protein [Actinokineospora sp. UTMC 2448]UVS78904.1 Polyketide biosynthesis malonyl CoA-acyl carrier protein transacylase PksC [Actinokineospora sp. UTMC 2448]
MTVLRLAAATPDALLDRLDREDARTAPVGAGPTRIAVADPTDDRLALARRVVAGRKAWRGRRDLWFAPDPVPGPVAFLFPGLEADFAPQVDDVAAWLGQPAPDLDTSTLGRHGAAVIAVGRLLDAALRKLRITPVAVAGHSVGEWTAMITGGLFAPADFEAMLAATDLDALRVPGVEFAVLGCPVERAREAIAPFPDVVVSHENSTNQTVVCGPAEPVGDVVALLRAKNVICQVMPFRSGFHTPMLAPYLDQFRRTGVPSLPLHPPSVPVWSATTARPFPGDPAAARELCIRHLVEPVRFRQLVTALRATGIRSFVQMGSGQLASLVSDTLRGVDHLAVAANSDRGPGMAQLRRAAAALWVDGADPDFTAFDAPVEVAAPVRDPFADAAARHPALAELPLLMREIEEAVQAVLAAADPGAGTLSVSTTDMPWLADHCFVRQRPGWPDETDLRPVVPATTILHHMAEASVRPGTVAVGVDDLRLHRWLVAAPATEVRVETRALGPDRVAVRLGEYAEGTVLLAPAYPAGPAPWTPSPDEHPPAITAERLYFERWMFHGPRYRGVSRTIGVGAASARAEITVPEAPGALLDNVGQVIGVWLAEWHPARSIAFPSGLRRVRFHGPQPAPGTTVACDLRITSADERRLTADAQVVVGGRTVITVEGWTDLRFDSDAQTSAIHRFPETSTLSTRHDAGWWHTADRWPTLASREFFLRKYLAAAERADYDRVPPRERRDWLVGRFAAKDAVRGALWDRGFGPLFPAEIRISDGADGLLGVEGAHGLVIPPLTVAVAAEGGVGVALVAEAEDRPAVALARVGPDGRAAAVARAVAAIGPNSDTEVVPVDGPDRHEYAVAWTRARHTQRETAP